MTGVVVLSFPKERRKVVPEPQTGVIRGDPTSLSRPSTSREDLRLSTAGLSTTCRKGTIHLQTYMSSPGFQPRPYGRAVSVVDHYTRWVTSFDLAKMVDDIIRKY
ncbi:hypothetical protein TNCV_1003781 [Trichonephila clavipes]|nr:hypothetical protein TNCV_1003781 [Trichonephila clavipes]